MGQFLNFLIKDVPKYLKKKMDKPDFFLKNSK